MKRIYKIALVTLLSTPVFAQDNACFRTGCVPQVNATVQEHLRRDPSSAVSELKALEISASQSDSETRRGDQCKVLAHWHYVGRDTHLGEYEGHKIGVWTFNNRCEMTSEDIQIAIPQI